jgi:hypothetical protein
MSESAMLVSVVAAYVASGLLLLKFSLGSATPKLIPVKVRARQAR